MGKFAARTLSVVFLLAQVSAHAEQPLLIGTPAIRYSLEKLSVLGSVLMIAAHPDDENNSVLAWCARGLKVRTGYLSCTRGEGGQNLLGPEQGPLLGVIRTQELLAARRVDGAAQYFTRAIDFGFTKTKEEALEKWGHDRTLSDMVWVIRQQQPDVILLVFTGTPSDGHGQHQASAILGKEAYTAAADPSRFPEQLQWVKPWQAHRLMQSRFTGGPPGGGRGGQPPAPGAPLTPAPPPPPKPVGPPVPTITLQAGDFDPVIGRSYREIASLSRNEHKSQAMASTIAYGDSSVVLAYVAGSIPKKDLFEGIDITWNRISGGARVGTLLAEAGKNFDDLHPEKSVAAFLQARPAIAALSASGNQWARWKLEELDQTIALCLGLRTEVQADAGAYVPGSSAKVQLTAINRSHLAVSLTGLHLSGWGEVDVPVKNKALAYNKAETNPAPLPVPQKRPFSQPFWLREPNNGNWYDIKDQTLIGRADIVPEVTARFDFALEAGTFSITEPLHFRYADPAKDEFVRPIAVEPPVAIDLSPPNLIMRLGSAQTVSVQVRALVANQSGDVRLDLPSGWSVAPAAVHFQLKEMGAAQEARFSVTPPAAPETGRFKVIAKLATGTEIATGMDVIAYQHIPAQTVMQPSEGTISAVSLKVLAKRVGYVMGSSDEEPEALRQMGCEVDLLDDKDLASGSLSAYDAIVTGVRAYSVRADLRAAQQRLLEYVKNGGTMVVQYNNNGDRRISPSVAEAFDHLGPYPFSFAGNNARVTDENAPVEFLSNSALLHFPNEITHTDFEGWVQERGLYFADKWDPHYETPLETHDKGESPLKGSLLYTRYGKGAYIFTAFSWFRELPAGVPGAYRIFANLISAGKSPRDKLRPSTMSITRRNFLAGAATALPGLAQKKNIPVGLEMYSVRMALQEDLMGTVRKVGAMGYQDMEFFAPYYDWSEQQTKDVRKLLDDMGVKALSTHNHVENYRPENIQKTIDRNKILGARFVVISSAGNPKTLDAWKKIADNLTAGADLLRPAGLRAGYHNHQAEFTLVEGKRPIEVIAANTPKDFMLQFDLGTCVEMGSDPVAWIDANPGRINSLHLKDWNKERGYRVLFGDGAVPWKQVFAAAEKTGGVEFYLIEQEGSDYSEFETAQRCLDAFKKLHGNSN